jgi:glycerol uptake facilitator protein
MKSQPLPQPPPWALCASEAVGTFLLVLFGCGAVHAAALSGAQSGLWQVAVVWGVAIMLACYVCGAASGAHINPAISIAWALCGRLPARLVLPYLAGQFGGAFVAAAVLYVAWSPWLSLKEKQAGVVRGAAGSEITAMCYGEYFPNPALRGLLTGGGKPSADVSAYVPHAVAFGMEVLGTLILALVVSAVTDQRNNAAPQSRLAPVFIGLTVAALVSIIAPLTQACFNPARDWGPRLFAYLAGWGDVAIPGPNGVGCVTVYLVAPVLGAALGTGLYERGVRRWMALAGNQD